jgi:isoleucyl-tRNA synthetase
MAKTIFDPVPVQVNFPELEEKILKFWKDEDIYQKIQDARSKSKKKYTWLEGPPTANGLPHAGHALTRTLKDIMLRYQTMRGYWVRPRIGGWDCHGLPVEIEVEKQLGLKEKSDIINYGIKDFNKLCRQSVLKYEREWVEMSERIGFWLDLDKPYITMADDYIESVWWSLKTLHEKGYLYKGLRVAPLCTRCGTTLSSHELALGYKEVEDPAIFIKFKAKDTDFDYYLAWTTTPWTLLSNVMLSVNASVEYAVVDHEGEKYLLAKSLIEKVFSEKKQIIKEYMGKDLEYNKYEPIFPYFSHVDSDNAFIVTVADYVTTIDGTGVVHSAPAFGSDDAETGRRYNAPIVNAVDLDGKFTNEVTAFAGMWVKDADKEIIKTLKTENKLFKRERYIHNYPHCWRCDTPLLYYGTESWFVAMSKLRDNLVSNNNKIHWQPDYLKQGRFGNFLESVVDWNLSRSRFWGTPLPIWICDGCENQEILISKKEIYDRVGDLPDDFELHRPWVDEITWNCNSCKEGTMIREPYVIDVWYDSGSAPFAQYHYPFENKEEFEGDFPFTWITEAIDQTRGWFYTLLAVSTALFDSTSFNSVLCMNHVLDANGQKMSKSKGNTIQTREIFDTVGADATRWYLSSSQAWSQTRFGIALIEEAQRKMMNTLWNVYSFFVTNANYDKFTPKLTQLSEVKNRSEIDRWIISRLQYIIKVSNEAINDMSFHSAVRAINYFIIEELSNWWLRRSRRRFYVEEITNDKSFAYDTLYEVLTTLTKLLAPFVPFLSEELYLNLVAKFSRKKIKSVHAEQFPSYSKDHVDQGLEDKMKLALDIANAGRAARAKANIKMRQPLEKLIAVNPNPDIKLGDLIPVLAGEINVKSLEILTPNETLAEYKIQPNLKVLAPKVKGAITGIKKYLENLSKSQTRDLVTKMTNAGKVMLEIENKKWEFTEEEINVHLESPVGYQMGQEGNIDVFLTTEITPKLKEEGLARELVRRIQEMRKSAKLDFSDRINVNLITKSENLNLAYKNFGEYIRIETQADSLDNKITTPDFKQDWDIENENLVLEIKKVK